MRNIREIYDRWLEKTTTDRSVREELLAIRDHPEQIEDAFYKDLSFGTGGLRGVIGAGTNRMNVYTVAKASQGVAQYVNSREYLPKRIAVSYDSRIKSDLFAKIAAGVFAANGIEVFIYPVLMPTPCLSFAVRRLCCGAGIMVTASHNPSKYNGYKVYGPDGCQITTEAAADIFSEIEKLDTFDDVMQISFEEGAARGLIRYIEDDVYSEFIDCVKAQSMTGTEEMNRDVCIVYTPLNGTGLKPVLRALSEGGYTNIHIVEEQKEPDGNFPTCPYPNPEIKEAMTLGIRDAKSFHADLLLATDPDCDRVGIAVRDRDGEFRLLSGNETGILLLDYVCARRKAEGKMPEDPVFVKTIVTTDMAEKIANAYGVHTVNVLTGFKFIGEQIGLLEKKGKADSYIFGFEESYGYLSGTYVRDKDAVNGAFLICEMFCWYKNKGISLIDKLNELYRKYNYCLNTLHSYEFEGASGFERMQEIMAGFRRGIISIGSKKVKECTDYLEGLQGLPRSDVLKFLLEGDSSVVVRPSGTEPKLKVYLSINAPDEEQAKMLETELKKALDRYFIMPGEEQ